MAETQEALDAAQLRPHYWLKGWYPWGAVPHHPEPKKQRRRPIDPGSIASFASTSCPQTDVSGRWRGPHIHPVECVTYSPNFWRFLGKAPLNRRRREMAAVQAWLSSKRVAGLAPAFFDTGTFSGRDARGLGLAFRRGQYLLSYKPSKCGKSLRDQAVSAHWWRL